MSMGYFSLTCSNKHPNFSKKNAFSKRLNQTHMTDSIVIVLR